MLQPNLAYSLQDKTSATSRQFGRYIYQVEQASQYYWLKLQLQQGHPTFKQGFQREIDYYQIWSLQHAKFLLPYQHDSKFHISEFDQTGSVLILPDTEIFWQSPRYLSFQHVVKLIQQALATLAALHDLNMIHGDLKAEHFRKWQGRVYLIDFEQSQSQQAPHLELNATPRYMAPELFHHQAKTCQTDLYAFGIILFEWLTQTRLRSKSYLDWAIFHCQTSVFNLPEPWNALQTCLNGLLARDNRYRFESANQASNCLQTINMT